MLRLLDVTIRVRVRDGFRDVVASFISTLSTKMWRGQTKSGKDVAMVRKKAKFPMISCLDASKTLSGDADPLARAVFHIFDKSENINFALARAKRSARAKGARFLSQAVQTLSRAPSSTLQPASTVRQLQPSCNS